VASKKGETYLLKGMHIMYETLICNPQSNKCSSIRKIILCGGNAVCFEKDTEHMMHDVNQIQSSWPLGFRGMEECRVGLNITKYFQKWCKEMYRLLHSA
jgi:hypothetical protein